MDLSGSVIAVAQTFGDHLLDPRHIALVELVHLRIRLLAVDGDHRAHRPQVIAIGLRTCRCWRSSRVLRRRKCPLRATQRWPSLQWSDPRKRSARARPSGASSFDVRQDQASARSATGPCEKLARQTRRPWRRSSRKSRVQSRHPNTGKISSPSAPPKSLPYPSPVQSDALRIKLRRFHGDYVASELI
ncbi:hypothetical protein ACVWXO_011155 [Bradyrhizobium sp. LM2.7]